MKLTDGAVFADLQLLTMLAQLRSFTQTAMRLGVSKASVSARIKELERAVGVPLVRRTTRSVTLTEVGLRLVDDIQASFAHIEHSYLRARDQARAPGGLVRISCAVALGRQRLAPLLPAFLAAYPEIRIEVELTDRLVNLAEEGFDLVLRHAHAAPETHVATVLCESRSLLVASPDYLRRRGMPQHPAELGNHDCLMYLRGGKSGSWSFERADTGASLSVAVSGPLKVNNSEVLREAVLGGLGIGLLPDFSALEELTAHRLFEVLPSWRPVGFFGERLYAIRPWTPVVPRAVSCLVDYLRQAFSEGFAVTAPVKVISPGEREDP
jgi:DNA-binding transcriptional LysR family regulator